MTAPGEIQGARSGAGAGAGASAHERVRRALEAGRAEVTGLPGAARGRLLRELLSPGPARARAVLCRGRRRGGGRGPGARPRLLPRRGRGAARPGRRGPPLRRPLAGPRHGDGAAPAWPGSTWRPEQVSAVVVSAHGLARRVVPRRVFEAGRDLLGGGLELDREALAARLVALGYARAPLVEDPGTFAVRGGILDLWSPAEPAAGAARVLRRRDRELPRLRPGDPAERGRGRRRCCSARPARRSSTRPARRPPGTAVRAAAERVNRPTTRVREVLDAIEAGQPFFGLEALLPGFHPGGLATLHDYLPAGAAAYLDDAAEVERGARRARRGARREHAAALGREELALPPEAHFLRRRGAALAAALARPAVRRHRVWLGTEEPIRFSLEETSELRGEIEAAHGDEGALGAAHAAAGGLAEARPHRGDRLRHRLRRRPAQAAARGPPPDGRSHTGAARRSGARSTTRPSTPTSSPGELSAGFVDGDGAAGAPLRRGDLRPPGPQAGPRGRARSTPSRPPSAS